MSISALTSVDYTTGSTSVPQENTLDELEQQKEELEEELEDLQSQDSSSNTSSDETDIQVIQNKLSLLELKISVEKAKQQKAEEARTMPPTAGEDRASLISTEGIDITA